jgi:hypothetical protein
MFKDPNIEASNDMIPNLQNAQEPIALRSGPINGCLRWCVDALPR